MFGSKKKYAEPCVMGDETLMSPKAHGTSATPVQKDLRWGCDYDTADRICNFNRHYAECESNPLFYLCVPNEIFKHYFNCL
jgi:hypothetical protein